MYDGTGLIGATIRVPGSAASAAVPSFVAAVKSVLGGGFTDADVGRAKAQAALAVLESTASQRAASFAAAARSSSGGVPKTPEEVAAGIQAVTAAQVGAHEPGFSIFRNV